MSYRPDDTIVMPTKRTRADGVNPDTVRTGDVRYERAIFSYAGTPISSVSTKWVPRVDVRLHKAIVLVWTRLSPSAVHFLVNGLEVDALDITGTSQQLTFTDEIDLSAETDTLAVSFTEEAAGAVRDLSVFVSFIPPD